jgi:two-component system NtrC family sensor kinase
MALSENFRLSDLLRKMLSFSKPDQEERHPVDINSVLDEILLLHEKQLKENNINITSKLAGGLGLVNASKNQLCQVFLNMVANARDAMTNGGTLTVVTGSDGEQVVIEITDTVTGIREEHIDKIFDSFFSTKSEVKGVGLGLSVCYGFIQDHGGDIEVKSKRGVGTTFTITLPVQGPSVDDENVPTS